MILQPTVNFKTYETGSSGSKGARFPLDLCLEANWLVCLRRHRKYDGSFSPLTDVPLKMQTLFPSWICLASVWLFMGLPLFAWLASKSCSQRDPKKRLFGLCFPSSVVEVGQRSWVLLWRGQTDMSTQTNPQSGGEGAAIASFLQAENRG